MKVSSRSGLQQHVLQVLVGHQLAAVHSLGGWGAGGSWNRKEERMQRSAEAAPVIRTYKPTHTAVEGAQKMIWQPWLCHMLYWIMRVL